MNSRMDQVYLVIYGGTDTSLDTGKVINTVERLVGASDTIMGALRLSHKYAEEINKYFKESGTFGGDEMAPIGAYIYIRAKAIDSLDDEHDNQILEPKGLDPYRSMIYLTHPVDAGYHKYYIQLVEEDEHI